MNKNTQYFTEKSGKEWLVKSTTGQNSEIIATFNSRHAALAYIGKLYSKSI